MNEVYVSENHPFYHVFINGRLHETLVMRWTKAHKMQPLTFSQQWDIANGYKEYLASE